MAKLADTSKPGAALQRGPATAAAQTRTVSAAAAARDKSGAAPQQTLPTAAEAGGQVSSAAAVAGEPQVAKCKSLAAERARQSAVAAEKTRQRNKATELIVKHAGAYAAEAQKTKWIVELVVRVMGESRAHEEEQDARIAALETELQEVRATGERAAAEAAAEAGQLRAKLLDLEAGLYNTGYALTTAQREHLEMQQALEAAEGTAAAATAECQQLAAAVRHATAQDARVRRSLAHRAHVLKVALVETSSQLRGAHDVDRKEFREAEWKLRERERAVAAERAALEQQREAAAARDDLLETFMLRLHGAEAELTRLREQQRAQQQAAALMQADPPAAAVVQ